MGEKGRVGFLIKEDNYTHEEIISGLRIRRNRGDNRRRREVLWVTRGGWVGFKNFGGGPCWVEVYRWRL